MINFFTNYVSLFEKEWFLGFLRLLGDIIVVGFFLFLLIAALCALIDFLTYF